MRRLTLPVIVTAFFLASAAYGAPSAPSAGVYAASIYINGISGNCVDSAGNVFAGVLSYGGVDADTLAIRIPDTATAHVTTVKFKVRKGQGGTAPSGTFVDITGGSSNYTFKGTFAANLYEIDPLSFAATLQISYNGCVENQTLSFAKVSYKP